MFRSITDRDRRQWAIPGHGAGLVLAGLAIAVVLVLGGAARAGAGEPEICYNETTPPPDAAPYEGITPFLGIGYGLSVTMFRRYCELDVAPDAAYWTAFWRHFGCSDASEVAQQISRVWTAPLPERDESGWTELKARYPDFHAEGCAILAEADFPETPQFRPESPPPWQAALTKLLQWKEGLRDRMAVPGSD